MLDVLTGAHGFTVFFQLRFVASRLLGGKLVPVIVVWNEVIGKRLIPRVVRSISSPFSVRCVGRSVERSPRRRLAIQLHLADLPARQQTDNPFGERKFGRPSIDGVCRAVSYLLLGDQGAAGLIDHTPGESLGAVRRAGLMDPELGGASDFSSM